MSDVPKALPNILWIGVDQLRYDTLGCNGNTICQTPQIDRLAGRGMTFDRAYCPASLCSPSRASMFTGHYAFTHGMGTNCDMYHALSRELAEPAMLLHPRLQAVGYRCGFVGKWHVGTELGPADYGFEGMSLPGYGNIRANEGFLTYLGDNGLSYAVRDPIWANPGENTLMAGIWDGPVESTPAYYLADYTIDMLEEYAGDDAPFFLTCQFWGPHGPHLPSLEYAGMYERAAIKPWINFEDSWEGKPAMLHRTFSDFYRARPQGWEEWREIVGFYYDFMTMIDAQIGRILERLETLGLAENTLVIFTTDHGDMTGSHGGAIDKGLMYEEAHHIPLIVSWPARFVGGQRSTELVYNMDIFPTLLDLLGAPDQSLDGRSILPALRGEAIPDSREELLLEFHGIRFLYSQRAIVTRDGWKYIFTPGDRDECYDLNEDPGELHNLVGMPAYAEKVKSLQEQMIRAVTKANDPLQACVSKFFGYWKNPPGHPVTDTL